MDEGKIQSSGPNTSQITKKKGEKITKKVFG
jgi:hypothetical protein